MDVRCERCSTEYELEDDSITDPGTQVQCTACGHTFLVTRPGGPAAPAPQPTPPPAVAEEGGPAAAEWLLETSDGELHRFRNLTSLQKWIIERKVTRDDRISRTGHAWKTLGEIVELAPFFDVVDAADRARAAGLAQPHRPPSGAPASDDIEATRRMERPGRRPAADDDMSVTRRRRRDEVFSDDEVLEASEVGMIPERPATRGWAKVVIGIAVAGGVAAGGIALLGRQGKRPSPAPSPAPIAAPALAPAPAPAPSPAPSPVPAPSGAGGAGGEAPAASGGAGGGEGAPADVAPAPAPAPAPSSTSAAAPAAPRGYDALIEQADKALENGATARAEALYRQAQTQRPQGAEAIAGLGYVALDRDRHAQALPLFKRALDLNPGYAPAIFGMAEAYRGQGAETLALELYRDYLRAAPGGADAAVARRQIQMIEAKQAGAAPGAGPPPAPRPITPPPPSAVVNEPASAPPPQPPAN